MHGRGRPDLLYEIYKTWAVNEEQEEFFWEILGETPAEKTFRKLETRIRQAKTLRVKISSQMVLPENAGGTYTVQGEVLLKAPSKIKVELQRAGQDKLLTLTSDGTRMVTATGVAHFDRLKDPCRSTHDLLRVCLSRACLVVGLYEAGWGLAFAQEESLDPNWEAAWRPFDLEQGVEPDGVGFLKYRLHPEAGRGETTLHFDLKTLSPLKRSLTSQQENVSAVDIYEEFLYDEDLPDRLFAHPKDK